MPVEAGHLADMSAGTEKLTGSLTGKAVVGRCRETDGQVYHAVNNGLYDIRA